MPCSVQGSYALGYLLLQPVRGKAIVARTPYCDRRVIPVAQENFVHILHEKPVVHSRNVVALGREPEIVEHEDSVLVAEVIQGSFGALSCPVPYHIEILFLVELEVWFEMLPRHILHGIVHSPVSSAAEYLYSVDLDHDIRARSLFLYRLYARMRKVAVQPRRKHALLFLHLLALQHVEYRFSVTVCRNRIEVHVMRLSVLFHDFEFIFQLTHAKAYLADVGDLAVNFHGHGGGIEVLLAVAVRPPQGRVIHCHFRNIPV